jgi:hypothetical protein
MKAVHQRAVEREALHAVPPVHAARMRGAASINEGLQRRFAALRDDSATRRSHYFLGRFENLYVERTRVPEVKPVLDAATAHAAELLGTPALRCGFWFNEMGPGQGTTLHSHDDDDELLAAVYYVSVPPGSGRLLLQAGDTVLAVTPEPGLFVFFPPALPHEVEVNAGRGSRLSLAMNFGPA